MKTLYTDIDPYCCAVLESRVADGSLPPGDVMLADVRTLNAQVLASYRHVHLFAGIGGFPLGLSWAGWPDSMSVVTFGFPCQDISAAGKDEGLSGARSGLFWEARRIVHEHQPDVCIAENVGALSRRGLDVVAGAMGEAGYLVPDAYRVGAWALGAPHVRERWWIVGWRRAFADADQRAVRLTAASRIGDARRSSPESGAEILTNAIGDRLANVHGLSPHARGITEGASQRDSVESSSGSRAREDLQPDAGAIGFGAVCGVSRDESGTGLGWRQPPALDQFKRNERGEWQYDGPPVLVYAGGAGPQERHAAPVASGARHAAWRPDPTIERGWPVPVLPGFEQHGWEEPRLHQRGMGRAVHGLSRRMADALNRSGLMACGNAIVPQVCAAIARGIIAGANARD